MPDVETRPSSDAVELGAEEFASALRDAVGRLEEDAAIARELNLESPAPDDVQLVRDTIMTYAEKIMQGEAIAKEVRRICFDEDAWTHVDAMRKKIFNMLSPLVE